MPERTTEEWGRVAVSLPGWRWMPGMLTNIGRLCQKRGRPLSQGNVALYLPGGGSPGRALVPDPDDPATEGCMVRLLGPVHEAVWYTGDCDRWVVAVGEQRRLYTSLGRACIAAAEALGRWPGGAE